VSFTLFLQVFFNIAILTAVFVIFARLRRPAKDDPRMSKGLQLLSSKIAVLEDLNDRTETQVQQMLTLLDQKSRELQAKIALAEQQVQAVRQSMDQSLEVAQIFQDKIPHNEIIERQNSMKYIKAARLAHAGYSVDQIAAQVDLPSGEIEFIAKVNRDSLSFREEELPAWAREPNSDFAPAESGFREASFQETAPAPQAPPAPVLSVEQAGLVDRLNRLQFEMKNLDIELATRAMAPGKDLSRAFETPQVESDRLAEIGERFRQAVNLAEPAFVQEVIPAVQPVVAKTVVAQPAPPAAAPDFVAAPPAPKVTAPKVTAPVAPELEAARAAAQAIRQKNSVSVSEVRRPEVRKVEFPRI
jgi:hypothetical protein